MANAFTIGGKTYNIGRKLGTKELQDIAQKSGYTLESVISRAKGQKFDVSPGAVAYKPPAKTPPADDTVAVNTTQPTGTVPISNVNEIGMTADQASDFQYKSGLITLQGNIEQELENLRGAWALKGTDISTARDLEARKYVIDRESLTQENVTKIQGQNNLDLRKLIEAGETERENIRGSTARDIERIQGEYNIQGENIRQAGQQRTADIQKAGTMYGSLINAFNF